MKKGKTKKVLSLMLSFIMIFSLCFNAAPESVSAAEDLTFTVSTDDEDGKVERGDQITVSVDMSGNTEAYGLTYEFKYDTAKLALEGDPVEGDAFATFGGMEFDECYEVEDGEIMAFILRSAAITNGNLMTMTFNVLEDAEVGEIDFESVIELSGEYGGDVTFEYIDDTNLEIVLPVKEITFASEEITLEKGTTGNVVATVSPEDTTSSLVWESSDESVATVAEDGVVTAVDKGTAVITAKADGVTASYTVNVTIPLKSIAVNGTVSTLKKGTTTQLTVTYDPDDTTDVKGVTWTSSNEAVAAVNEDGVVTAIADGVTTITATVGNLTATYEITVEEVKLTSITLDQTALTMNKKEEATLTVGYVPANTTDDTTVVWTSSNTDAVTVENGKVTAIGVGTSVVTAKVGEHEATCSVTVISPLTEIKVNESSLDLVKNETATIKYTVVPEDTTDSRDVTYTTSNEAVATVDANGNIAALSEGTAIITLTGANGVTAAVTVNVTEIHISSVTLDKTEATVEAGETVQLTATVAPANHTDDNTAVTWSSSDETVATVDANGLVTAVAGGKATITATTWNGKEASFEITIPVHIEAVAMNKTATTIAKGFTEILSVTITPANATDDTTVTWTSSNEEVATVDANGKVTAVKVGEAVITATVGTFKTECTVTVNAALTLIEPEKEAYDLVKGETTTISYTLKPEDTTDSRVVTFTSDNEDVATVDANGVVTAVAEGKATITIAGANNVTATVTVNVTEIHISSVALNKTEATVEAGETVQLAATVNPANHTDEDTKITWTSSDESVATVNADGLVTAVAGGKATITATTWNGKTAACEIIVPIHMESISVDKTETTIARGSEETLTVTITPANTTDDKTVTWISSDEDVVTVDADGKVTAVGIGEAIVTAKVGNFTATCEVTVNAPLESIEVQENLEMVKNQTATIEYSVNPSDTTDSKAVTFSSDNEEVASVDANGVVTAKKTGTAVITLTSAADADIVATVTVKVTEIPISEVVIDKVNAIVEKGETVQLTATVGPENHTDDATITWTSSDESVATVDANGLVTAVASGKATITATASNGTKAICEITVPAHIESIELSGKTVIDRNETTVLAVTYNPENTTDDKAVTWSSSNEEVASVDPATGMITGLKAGKTTISATTTGTTVPVKATLEVIVNENHLTPEIAEEITIEKPDSEGLKGQTVDLGKVFNIEDVLEEYSITDDIKVEWSSSDESVATVNNNGVVTGVKEGTVVITATIKATNGDGLTVTYTVTTEMEIKEIPLESIAFEKEISELKVGETGKLVVVYTPENTTDLKNIEWSSSDVTVLTVEDGVITGVKEGTAEVTAKVGDLTVTCKVTVKPAKTTTDSTTDSNGKDSVQTGDSANITLYIVLLVVAAVVILFFSKKRIFTGRR